VANVVTLARVVLLPFAVVALLQDTLEGFLVAIGLLAMGEITDFTDGYLARVRNEVSDFGKLLDPLCDAISRSVVMAVLFSMGYGALWMVMLVVLRDTVMAYLRSFAAGFGVVMAARPTGKIKAAVQATAEGVVLVGIVWAKCAAAPSPSPFELNTYWLLVALPVVGTVVYVLAFRIRGYLLAVIVACSVIIVGLLVVARVGVWQPFDAHAFAYWPLLVAALTAGLSLLDYVWHFARVVVPAAEAKVEGGG
jgi:CDP-diacylglycerol--glycerol-3-phosphate 3-phosphatidyltransferase